jgi:hypothetical protein
MAKPTVPVSSHTILETLQTKLWVGDPYAWLFEVRNGTGWQRDVRSADALCISCWPSRGIYCHGIEVKISRSDWVRELKNPEKSCAIQKYCKYWWVAAPPGIVRLAELPENWGLIEVQPPRSYKVEKKAPELKAEEPNWTFVASALRNGSARERAAETRGRNAGLMKAREEQADAFAKLIEEQKKIPDFTAREIEHTRLKSIVEDFERRSGLNLTSRWKGTEHAAKTMQLAKVLMDHGFPSRLVELEAFWRNESETISRALTAAIAKLNPEAATPDDHQ